MPELNTQSCTPTNSAPKGIPLSAIVDYVENKGLTISETARLLGCNKSNIKQRLQHVGLEPGYLKKYKENRADILAAYQCMLLNSLTADDLKRAGLSQKLTGFGILFDKERLERGQSTENIAYSDMVKAKELVDKDIEAFKAKYGMVIQDGNSDRKTTSDKLLTGPD